MSRQSSVSSRLSTRRIEALAQPRVRQTHARARVLTRSPCWLAQNDGHALPNLVSRVVYAVIRLGEEIIHCQADQIRLELASKFLVTNFDTVLG